MFLPVPQVPEPVRKLRETHRKNSHQFRSKSVRSSMSYDQKTKNIISLKMLSDVFDCFWLLFWSPSCLKSSGILLGSISTKFRTNPMSYNKENSHVLLNNFLTNNFGVYSSDLHETWWKLIPGVSRSFLNSSGTKITAKNTKK